LPRLLIEHDYTLACFDELAGRDEASQSRPDHDCIRIECRQLELLYDWGDNTHNTTMTSNRRLRVALLIAISASASDSLTAQPAEAARSYPSPAGARPTVALTAKERAIAAEVDANRAKGLALLEQLVNINSGTMNFAGVKLVGDKLRTELDALGFETKWIDGAPFGRAGHLVAERTGKGPRILLIGHLDTVFEPGSTFQKFERLSDTTARGPGITDMKGGNVIIVQALAALKAARVLDDMSISVVFTGDEESSGDPLPLARAALIEAAKRSQFALGFEDGAGDPRTAVVSRRGSTSWVLESTGIPAHSSQIFRPDIGAGAIFESARVLDQLRAQLGGRQYLTFNPGYALGGTDITLDSSEAGGTALGKTNVVSKSMRVHGDIRAISPAQLDSAQRTMHAIASGSLPRTTSKFTFDDGYPPLAPSDGNRRLLAAYDKVSRDLGYWPVVAVDPMRAGAADVSFTAPHTPAAMDALGLSGWDGHTDKETADLRQFSSQTKRAAVLMYRLATGSSNAK
jgi:glutamate carboxypeptidase